MASFDIDNHCQKLQICSRQPTESSSSKTKQLGGNIPGPGSCSSPVCGKPKEPARTNCYLKYIWYLPSPRPSPQTCYIFSLPLEHSEPDTPIALCRWSAARLLQRSPCDVQLGTVLCDLQTGPQCPKGAGAHLHSLPVFALSHCIYSPRAAEYLHKVQTDFTSLTFTFAKRRETKVCSTNSQCHEHEWPQNSEDFAKALQINYLLFAQSPAAQNATGREHLVSTLGIWKVPFEHIFV